MDDVQAQDRVLARPVAGVEAADLAQRGGPHDEVAAWQVVLVADARGRVAAPVAARDEEVLVDATAHLREEGVGWRRAGGAAHGGDRCVGEVGDGVLQPARLRRRVVVHERDQFAGGLLDAEVALFGGADLAGGDFADAGAPVAAGGGVGQDEDFEGGPVLSAQRLDAPLEDGGGAGAGDDGGDARREGGWVVRFERLVVAQHAEAVEDGERVRHDLLDVGPGEAAGLAAEVEFHGGFGDVAAVVAGDGEDLEIEGEALGEHAGEGVGEGVAAEELHARLRVVDGQAHEQFHEAVVDDAGDAALERIVDFRLRVHLGADHDIRAFVAHDLEEAPDEVRIEVEVGVEEQDMGAAGSVEAAGECGALAAVGEGVDGVDGVGQVFGGAADLGGRVVGAAVVHGHDLEGDAAREDGVDPVDVAVDRAAEVEGRHHDGETPRRSQARQSGRGRAVGRAAARGNRACFRVFHGFAPIDALDYSVKRRRLQGAKDSCPPRVLLIRLLPSLQPSYRQEFHL